MTMKQHAAVTIIHSMWGLLKHFYARQLYRQVLLRARISYRNSVCLYVGLSVCLG